MTSYQTGARYERELTNRFREHGWGALRLPSSGSATTRELPDVLAGRNLETDYGQAFAIELKAGKQTTLYVTEREVIALCEFSNRWGCTSFLGARFTANGTPTDTYLVRPADARGPTNAGNYGLPVSDIEWRACVVVGSEGVDWCE